jgi:uncharacterized coiled-coil protein SlyX
MTCDVTENCSENKNDDDSDRFMPVDGDLSNGIDVTSSRQDVDDSWKVRVNELEFQLSMAEQEISNLRRQVRDMRKENDDLMKAVSYLRTKLESNSAGQRAPTPADARLSISNKQAGKPLTVGNGPSTSQEHLNDYIDMSTSDVISGDVNNSVAHSSDRDDAIPKNLTTGDQNVINRARLDDDSLGVSSISNGTTSVDKCRLIALEDDNS